MDAALARLLQRADAVLAGRPDLMRCLRDDPRVFVALPLSGLRPQQKRRAKALAKQIHALLSRQPLLLPLEP